MTPLYQNDDGSSDYHGYGAVDEYAVEDRFGTMQDVQNLVVAAHQLGMKVLFDMVPNHVGPRHPWANSQPFIGGLHGTPAHHVPNRPEHREVEWSGLRGIPQVYSGDEIGIPGGEDPDNRRDSPGGFPGDTNNAFTWEGRTAEQQDIFAHTQALLRLREQHPALRRGKQEHVAVGDRYYVFTREGDGERLFVVFHNGLESEHLDLDLAGSSISDAKTLVPIFGPSTAELQSGHVSLQLKPYSLTIVGVK